MFRVFLCLTSLSMIISRSTHVAAKSMISFFSWLSSISLCVCVRIHTHTCICTHTYTCIYARARVYVHTCVYTCAHVYMYTHVYICARTRVYVHTHVYIRTHMCICTHPRVYTCTPTCICTHTHIFFIHSCQWTFRLPRVLAVVNRAAVNTGCMNLFELRVLLDQKAPLPLVLGGLSDCFP